MKNTLILVGVLLAFGAAYFLFVYNRDTSTSLNTGESAFAIQDTAIVGKVKLRRINKGKETESYEIRRGPDGWKDGDGFPLFQPRINGFLGTVAQLYVRDPIQDKGQQSALTILKRSHTEVTFFDLSGKQIKKYYVGPPNSPQTANIMLLEGADNSYLVSKPGFTGYISIYFVAEPGTWREKMLFNVKAENLADLKIDYLKEGGFHISRPSKDAGWKLEDGQDIDKKVSDIYLEPFKGKIYAESFADENFAGAMDTLKTKAPDVRLSYRTFSGEARTLVMYIRSENPNGYFGWMEDTKVFYTIQRSVIDKFLVPKDYFLQKTES